ncbi:MAG TPA: hypothetical protein VJ953_21990 [Saprospiraceae bacterium]|nr:hypothetical protein [Saprospiraceae bacterium]
MENSKLIGLLRSFNEQEWIEFGDFVASPYFNKRSALIRFYEVLSNAAPDFSGEQMKKEQVFSGIFPREGYDDKKMAYHMNYLLKLAEQFLGRKVYESRAAGEQLDILEGFVRKGQGKNFQFLEKKLKRFFKQRQSRESDYWYHRFRFAAIQLEHFNTLKKRSIDPSFQEYSDTLDTFFLFEKLRHASSIATLQDLVTAEVDLGMVDEIIQFLAKADHVVPEVDVYRYLFLAYRHSDSTYFEQFLTLLRKQVETASPRIKRELFLFAINFCGRQIMAGHSTYYTVMLDLYMEGVDNRALFEGEYLSPWTYTNVVKLALGLKKIGLLEEFIETHSAHLPPGHRVDAEHLNRAELSYFKKDYGEVLDNLNKLEHSDFYYTLGSRVLLLKTFYAQDDIEPLLSQITAFNQYLRRNKKLSGSVKKPFSNFCRSLALILRSPPKKAEKVRQQIEELHPVAEKSWLLETLKKELG